MRHNKKVNHLSRKTGHRHAMLSNMASSLVLHKRINTTLAKAKALRVYVEPLITKSKDDTTHSRRVVFSYLKNKESVTELFRIVAPKVANRPGGYTRVLKTGFRPGDAAEMALIELVDFNEAALTADKKAAKKTTRRSRAKKTEQTVAAKPVAVTPVAAPVEEIAAPVEETVDSIEETVDFVEEKATETETETETEE